MFLDISIYLDVHCCSFLFIALWIPVKELFCYAIGRFYHCVPYPAPAPFPNFLIHWNFNSNTAVCSLLSASSQSCKNERHCNILLGHRVELELMLEICYTQTSQQWLAETSGCPEPAHIKLFDWMPTTDPQTRDPELSFNTSFFIRCPPT